MLFSDPTVTDGGGLADFWLPICSVVSETLHIFRVTGDLLAGRQGLVNGVTWGIVLGLVSVTFMSTMIGAKPSGDVTRRYGSWRYKNELEGGVEARRLGR